MTVIEQEISPDRFGLNVRCRHVGHIYQLDGENVAALESIDLEILAGESVAILGPSGSGKSTLLRLIAGLLRPTSGEISIDGRLVGRMSESQLLALRRCGVGIVVQNAGNNLLPYGTAEDNVRFAQRPLGRAQRAQLPTPHELLGELGLGELLGRRVAQMSGGEQQRLAVAVAMATTPGLLLADEPTSQLDGANRDRVVGLLTRISARFGSTIIAVTHDVEVAAALGRTITIAGGRLALDPDRRRDTAGLDWQSLDREKRLNRRAAAEGLATELFATDSFGSDSFRTAFGTDLPAALPLADRPAADIARLLGPPSSSGARMSAIHIGYERAGRMILDDVALDVEAGQVVALLGPSGSGKSSLLAILAGLEAPDSGEVTIDGRQLGSGVPADVGLVLQGYGLVGVLTAAENVGVCLQARATARSEVSRRSQAALELVGLSDVADHLIEELSGGQQQRVAVARALVIEPRILLADEITAELDQVSRERLLDIVFAFANRGGVVVLATHDVATAQRCDRQVVLADGRLAGSSGTSQSGTAQSGTAQSGTGQPGSAQPN